MNDKITALSKTLDDVKTEIVLDEKKLNNQLVSVPDILDDYTYTRKKLRKLIEKSEEAIEIMFTLTEDSEHPRAGEVLSQMIKNTADMIDKLIDTQQKMKKLSETDAKQSANPINTGTINNNNLFIGSTNELQKMIKDNAG